MLLHHVGRNSGKASITPLMYFTENDRTYIVASYAGADEHPAWYYNVLAAPSVSAEIGTETKSYRAVEVDRSERDRLYADVIVPTAPGFADYEKKTTRIIPVIELLPVD